MMLQGVTINFVAFARFQGNLHGQSFALFILTVAACEAAIAMALILMLYKQAGSLDVSVWQDLREPDQEPTDDDQDPLPIPAPAEPMPVLTPAGCRCQSRRRSAAMYNRKRQLPPLGTA